MPRVSINVTDDIHAQLMKLAEKDGSSVSIAGNKAIEIGLYVLDNQAKQKQQKDFSYQQLKFIVNTNELVKHLLKTKFNYTYDDLLHVGNITVEKLKLIKQ